MANFPMIKNQLAKKIKEPGMPTAPSMPKPPGMAAAPPVIAAPTVQLPPAQSFTHMADMIKQANPGHNGTLDKIQSDMAKKESMSQKFADSMRQRKIEALRGIIKGGK